MKFFKKSITALFVFAVVICLCACGQNDNVSEPTYDCKFGEAVSLGGESYKMTKIQYAPAYDAAELDMLGIQITVLTTGDSLPLAIPDGTPVTNNAEDFDSSIEITLFANTSDDTASSFSEFPAKPDLSTFLVHGKETDETFISQFVLNSSVDRNAKLIGATVYINRGKENEEKVTVDLAAATIAEA